MRKMLTAALLMCTVAVLFTLSMPAVSAQPNKPLRCEAELTLVWVPLHWEGVITGDIEGTVTLIEMEPSLTRTTEHYFETWYIVTDEGLITIYQEGVWSFLTFEFKSNGWVTDATGTWEYLLGSDAHVRGVTTSPFTGEEVTGTGTMWLCGFGPE